MNNTSSVRQLAWKCLLRWSQGGIFAETLVARAAAENNLSHSDRSLLQAIVYDTLRHLSWLDHIRKELRPGKLEEKMRWLVLLGLCQLFILRQPEHAAVSETVSLAPQRVRGVVNGMLRNAARRRSAAASNTNHTDTHLLHWSDTKAVHGRSNAPSQSAHCRLPAHATRRHSRSSHPGSSSQKFTPILIHDLLRSYLLIVYYTTKPLLEKRHSSPNL